AENRNRSGGCLETKGGGGVTRRQSPKNCEKCVQTCDIRSQMFHVEHTDVVSDGTKHLQSPWFSVLRSKGHGQTGPQKQPSALRASRRVPRNWDPRPGSAVDGDAARIRPSVGPQQAESDRCRPAGGV